MKKVWKFPNIFYHWRRRKTEEKACLLLMMHPLNDKNNLFTPVFQNCIQLDSDPDPAKSLNPDLDLEDLESRSGSYFIITVQYTILSSK